MLSPIKEKTLEDMAWEEKKANMKNALLEEQKKVLESFKDVNERNLWFWKFNERNSAREVLKFNEEQSKYVSSLESAIDNLELENKSDKVEANKEACSLQNQIDNLIRKKMSGYTGWRARVWRILVVVFGF